MTTLSRHILFSCVLALAAFPLFARTESVLWNSVLPSIEYQYTDNDTTYGGNVGLRQTLDSVNVSVQYGATVFEVNASGAKIRTLASGSSVPAGTRVLFEFEPHDYTDITYNGTGGISDTPYGLWADGAALPAPTVVCKPDYLYDDRDRLLYAALSGNPPEKTIPGLPGGCTTASDGVSKICTLTNPATINAMFTFEDTIAHFYSGYNHNSNSSKYVNRRNSHGCEAASEMPMNGGSGSSPYAVSIPTQSIPFTLTVESEEEVGVPPSTPTLSTGGSCTVGTPHTITFSAADPDGDAIRYGIDWNANGSIDQYVPPSGYVPSGTPQSATRTYAIAGPKTVKVLAQDEGGLSSSWATLSFNCADAPEEEDEEENDQCLPTYICHDNDLYHRSGAQCAETFIQTCSYACSNGACILPQGALGNITAIPSLLRVGQTSTIAWTTSGMTSCSVSENNPTIADAWTGTNGTFQSSPIAEQTTYTLACSVDGGGLFSDTATINIAPVFLEQ